MAETRPFWEPLTGALSSADVAVIREHMDALRAENQRLSQMSGSMPERLIERLTHVAEELRLPREMAGLGVADTNGWLFDETKDYEKGDLLAAAFPATFEVLTVSRNVANQLWGHIDGGLRGFWAGRYNYTYPRSVESTSDSVFAFEIKSSTALEFWLDQHTSGDRLADSVGDRGITTESEDFNSNLHIGYTGDRGVVGPDILQVLTPDVQEALRRFDRQHDEFRLAVGSWVLLLAYSGDLPATSTDIQQAIDSAVALAETMLPCLDRIAG